MNLGRALDQFWYDIDLPRESFDFGIDEYLKASNTLAECLTEQGRYDLAIEKYECIKKQITAEIVFDKPVMLINTLCMQGNCLLKLKQIEKAKSNFTHALNQIQKL